jgi:hypothetical protein
MKKDDLVSASNAIKKFITTFYKDVDFDDVSVANNIYEIPYIVVWYNQKDPEDKKDYINLRHRIIQDIEDYMGYRLSPDPTTFIGSSSRGKYANADFYIDVRSNNVKIQ